jgi:Zn-dependent M16 (insulinase) family peptidase
MQQAFLPGTTYSHVSGGDPANITDLTWEQLREFHRQHYHPSNSKLYTYGNYPLENHLAYLDDKVLSRFDHLQPPVAMTHVQPFSKSQRITASCPPDPSIDECLETQMTFY